MKPVARLSRHVGRGLGAVRALAPRTVRVGKLWGLGLVLYYAAMQAASRADLAHSVLGAGHALPQAAALALVAALLFARLALTFLGPGCLAAALVLDAATIAAGERRGGVPNPNARASSERRGADDAAQRQPAHAAQRP